MGAPLESTVSLRVVRGLVGVVEQAGVSSVAFLRAFGLTHEQLHAADGRMPRSKVYELCGLALDLTSDPALGLHWAERFHEGTFVPISQLMVHAATLQKGFDSLNQFSRLLADDPSYQLVRSEGKVTLRVVRSVGESARIQRFVAEMMIAGFYRIIRSFSVHAQPEQVCFEYPAPAYQVEYARVFERPVKFGQAFSGIVFDGSLLDTPAPHKDDDVHRALEALAVRRLMKVTQETPYALRVREFLVQQGGPQRTEMSAVARAVGLSVRSLRRRLTDEGASYNTLANDAQMIVAKHFLRDKRSTIQETAFLMGFADVRAFHRAFRRWTGTTPSAYQNAPSDEFEPGR